MATIYNVTTGDIKYINQFQDSIAVDALGDSIIQIDDTSYNTRFGTLPSQTNRDFAIYTEIPKWQFFNGSMDWKYSISTAADNSGRILGSLIKDAHDPSSTAVAMIQKAIMNTDLTKHVMKNIVRTTRFSHFKQCSRFFRYSFKVGDPITIPVLDTSGNETMDPSGTAYTRRAQLYAVYLNKTTGEALPFWTQSASDPNTTIYYYADNTGYLGNAFNTIASSGALTVNVSGASYSVQAAVPPNPDGYIFSDIVTDASALNTLVKNIAYELPPQSMTALTTSTQTGNVITDGTYTAFSSTAQSTPHLLFDKDSATRWMTTGANAYATPSAAVYSSGSAVVTYDNVGNGYSGEWLQLQCTSRSYNIRGYKIRPVTVAAQSTTDYLGLSKWTLLGSNTAASGSWVKLDSSSNATFTTSGEITINLPATTQQAFSYFRLVVESSNGTRRALIGSLSFIDAFNSTFPSTVLTSSGSNVLPEGTFIASASSVADPTIHPAFIAFTKPMASTTTFWASTIAYNWSGASYTAGQLLRDVQTKNSVNGEYIFIRVPTPMVVTSYSIQASGMLSTPMDFALYGSYNSSDWYLLDTQSNITDWTPDSKPKTFTVSNPLNTNKGLPFSVYAILITKVNNSRVVNLADVRLYAVNTQFPEYRFPPLSMTASSVTVPSNVMISGTYVASYSPGSSTTGNAPFAHANILSYQNTWQAGALYNSSPYAGNVVTIADSSFAYSGEWLQIQCPSGIRVSSYQIFASGPRSFALLGSNNGTTWSTIDASSGVPNASYSPSLTFNIVQPSGGYPSYSYYRIVVQDAGLGYGSAKINELKLIDVSSSQFPPVPLTSNSSNGYTITTSTSLASNPAYFCFDGNSNTSWISFASGRYVASSGGYQYTGSSTTTTALGVTYSGEWVQLSLPASVKLTKYTFFIGTASAVIDSFVLLGSPDGTNNSWQLVDSRAGLDYSGTTWNMISGGNYQPFVLTPSNPGTTGFKVYRLIVRRSFILNPGINHISYWGTVTDRSIPSGGAANFVWAPPAYTSITNTTNYARMSHVTSDPSRALILYWDVSPVADKAYTGDDLYVAWSSLDHVSSQTFTWPSGAAVNSVYPVRDLDPSAADYASQLNNTFNKFWIHPTLNANTVRQVHNAINVPGSSTQASRLSLPVSYITVQERLSPTDASATTRLVPFSYEAANRSIFTSPANTVLGGRLIQLLSHHMFNNVSESAMQNFTNLTSEVTRITDTFAEGVASRLQATDASANVRRTDFLNQIMYRYGRQAFDEFSVVSSAPDSIDMASVPVMTGPVREVLRNIDDLYVDFALTIDSRVSNRSSSNSDPIRIAQVPVIIRLTPSIFTDDTAPFLDLDADYTEVDSQSGVLTNWPNLAFRKVYMSQGSDLNTSTVSGGASYVTPSLVTSASGITGIVQAKSYDSWLTFPKAVINNVASTGFTAAFVITPSVTVLTGSSCILNISGLLSIGRASNSASLQIVVSGPTSLTHQVANILAVGDNTRKVCIWTMTPSGAGSQVCTWYVNGTVASQQTVTCSLNTTANDYLSIGGVGYSLPGTSWEGSIHQVQLYQKGLTLAQAVQLNSVLMKRWGL